MTKQGGWPPSGFGTRLRELREGHGLTGEKLAELAGCHPMTISKLERGTQEPAWPLVLALCQALGVEVGAFVVSGQAQAEEVPKKSPGRPARKRSVGNQADETGKDKPRQQKRK